MGLLYLSGETPSIYGGVHLFLSLIFIDKSTNTCAVREC